MNMRNATCVGTQTSKAPTRVTLLLIFYSVPIESRALDRRLRTLDSLSSNAKDFVCHKIERMTTKPTNL